MDPDIRFLPKHAKSAAGDIRKDKVRRFDRKRVDKVLTARILKDRKLAVLLWIRLYPARLYRACIGLPVQDDIDSEPVRILFDKGES
jgi:hypothetical protein